LEHAEPTSSGHETLAISAQVGRSTGRRRFIGGSIDEYRVA
jgi:hypothetical protein